MAEPQATGKRSAKGSKNAEKKAFVLQDEVAAAKEIIHSSAAAEEKLPLLYKKFNLAVQEHKAQEKRIAESLRKQIELAQQKETIQGELTRTVLAKNKLESLCRELQKHSKAVVDESRLRAKEEEERRDKFKVAVDEISVKMQENFQCSERLRQENLDLSTKLQEMAQHYDEREQEFEKVLKQKQVEMELLEVKLAQKSVAVAQERENSMAERQCFLEKSLSQQRRCDLLAKQEADLKNQVSLYSEKFDEFQTSLNKSNEMFNNFKKEMTKLSKRLKEVEKDRAMWRTRCEKANQSLLKTAEECIEKDKLTQSYQDKNEKLEKICRALQLERTQLREELKMQTTGECQTSNTGDGSSEVAAASDAPGDTNEALSDHENEESCEQTQQQAHETKSEPVEKMDELSGELGRKEPTKNVSSVAGSEQTMFDRID